MYESRQPLLSSSKNMKDLKKRRQQTTSISFPKKEAFHIKSLHPCWEMDACIILSFGTVYSLLVTHLYHCCLPGAVLPSRLSRPCMITLLKTLPAYKRGEEGGTFTCMPIKHKTIQKAHKTWHDIKAAVACLQGSTSALPHFHGACCLCFGEFCPHMAETGGTVLSERDSNNQGTAHAAWHACPLKRKAGMALHCCPPLSLCALCHTCLQLFVCLVAFLKLCIIR